MAQMLEQVGHEPGEVLALLGQLFDEVEESSSVAVDDQVADAEEGLLLDGPQELENGLDADLSLGRRGELVECRNGVAKASARASRNQREGGVGSVDLLTVRNSAKKLRQIGQPRPGE